MTKNGSWLRSTLGWLGAPVRFSWLAYVLVLVAMFTVAVQLSSVQGDTWWALRAGKDMWHSGRPITTDTYSYTAYGDPWPDHSWGYQVILYALYVIGKFPLLTVAHAALAMLAVAIARPPGRVTWADVIVSAPVVALVSLTWAVRPQMVTLMLLALLIRLIHAERWRTIVVVMLLWANLHGGVVFGGLVLGAATFASVVSWAVARHAPAAERGLRRRRVIRLLLTTVAAGLATLINPLGWGLWRYVVTSQNRPIQNMITEWRPSWEAPGITGWFWAWCGFLVLVLLLRWRRLLQWPVLVGLCMALAIAPLAWTSMRNIGVFGIVTLPLLITLLRRPRLIGPEPAPNPGSLLPGGRIALALALVAAGVSTTHTLTTSAARLGWTPMAPAVAKAINSCPGEVYTTYNSGAYLIWFTPEKRVFVDNRQDPYSAEILEMGLGQGDWQAMFDKYGVKCAALNLLADPQAIIQIGALGGWPVLYADAEWVILAEPLPGATAPSSGG